MTIIMVTHDLEIAQYGDRVISMRDGKIIKIVNNTNAQGITKDEII